MQIERTDKEILIRVSVGTDLTGLQRLLTSLSTGKLHLKAKLLKNKLIS